MILIIVYLVCFILNYGITLAYFQRKYTEVARENYFSDVSFAIYMGILGPLGTVIAFFMSEYYKYGLMYIEDKEI